SRSSASTSASSTARQRQPKSCCAGICMTDLQFCEAAGGLTRRLLNVEVRMSRDPLCRLDLRRDCATYQRRVGLKRDGREVTAVCSVHDRTYRKDKFIHVHLHCEGVQSQ